MKDSVSNLWRATIMAVLMLLPQFAFADWLHGRVVDAETGEAVPFADIESMMSYNGGNYANHFTADSLGNFYCKCWYQGRYVIKASMIGYKDKKLVTYAHGQEYSDTIDLGDIKIKPDPVLLSEVTVKARARRITMAGDTIVFHPEAFMLKEGASFQGAL